MNKKKTSPASTDDTTPTKGKAAQSTAPSVLWQNEDCLLEMCSYLGRGDLHSLLTVNRAFYNAATPILYRVLVQRAGCPCHGLLGRNEALAAQFSTALEFFPHSHQSHHPRLKAPRVRTHIVNYDFQDKSAHLDKHGRSTAWGTHKCINCPKAPPPPERIVLRPSVTVLDYQPYDKRPKRVLVPLGTKCTNKIVHVSLNTGRGTFSAQNGYRRYPKPVTPTQTLTFVILPRFWDCGHVVVGDAKYNLLRTLMESIAGLACTYHDHSVHVVGLEDWDPFSSANWEIFEDRESRNITEFKRQLDSVMNRNFLPHWTSDDKEACRNKFTYQTFRDYLQHGDWGEEFSWQLVGRWLNALELSEKGLMKTPVLPGSKKKTKVVKKAVGKKRKRKRNRYETETESEIDFTDDESDWGDEGETEVAVKAEMAEPETDEEDY